MGERSKTCSPCGWAMAGELDWKETGATRVCVAAPPPWKRASLPHWLAFPFRLCLAPPPMLLLPSSLLSLLLLLLLCELPLWRRSVAV